MNGKHFIGNQQLSRKLIGRTKEALRQRNVQFAQAHGDASDEALLDYVRSEAARFGGWQNVITSAGLPSPKKQKPTSKRQIFKEEFPLLEIQGVSADAGWFTSYVSFLTHTKTIDFLVHYKKERYQAIVRVLNEAIKTAVNHYNDNTLVYNPDDTVTVVTCAGCGATNILQKSTIKPCAYCGRSLSSE